MKPYATIVFHGVLSYIHTMEIHDLKKQWLKWAIAEYSDRIQGSCWLWRRSKNSIGYGLIKVNYKTEFAHRISYTVFKGPIPAGLCVCHTCDHPACVNPDHLWLGTRKQNSEDMVRKGRASRGGNGFKSGHSLSHCKRIRKLTDEDVYFIRRSDWPLRHLADKFKVSMATISTVRRGLRKTFQ